MMTSIQRIALWVGIAGLAGVAAVAAEPTPAPGGRAWLGVLLGDAVDGGTEIAALVPGGPAERAGLVVGDLILEANGLPVPSREVLGRVLGGLAGGDSLKLKLLRKGQTVAAEVQLGRRSAAMTPPGAPAPPESPRTPTAPPAPTPRPSAAVGPAAWGIRAVEVTPALRKHYGAPEDAGVLVVRVEPGTAASRSGVVVGDIVVTVAGRQIRSPRQLETTALVGLADGPVQATLVRNGRSQEISLPAAIAASAVAPSAAPAVDQQLLRRMLEEQLRAAERRVAELRRRLAELEKGR